MQPLSFSAATTVRRGGFFRIQFKLACSICLILFWCFNYCLAICCHLFRTFLGSTPTMLIYDLDFLKTILVKDFTNFQNRLVSNVGVSINNINPYNFIRKTFQRILTCSCFYSSLGGGTGHWFSWLTQLVRALSALTNIHSCAGGPGIDFPKQTSSILTSISFG